MWLFQPLTPATVQQQAGLSGISGSASQTLAFSQVAAGTIEIQGTAGQNIGVTQSAAGTIGSVISGEATQSFVIDQVAAVTVEVQGIAASTLQLSQTSEGSVTEPIYGAAQQLLTINQSARGLIGGQITIWRAIHDAVYVALVAGLADVATVYDAVPHNAAYPYVDLAAQNRSPNDTLRNHGFTFQFYPAIYSQHKGAQEVRNILDAIDTTLHEAHLTLATGHAVRCSVTDSRCVRDADGRTYQGAATIEIFAVI